MINKTKKSEFDHFSGLASEWRTKNGKFKGFFRQIVNLKYLQISDFNSTNS